MRDLHLQECVVLKKDKFYQQARLIRNLDFDNSKRFQHDNLYWNYRLGGIQAALGLSQLKNIDSVISEKIDQGKYYTQLLGSLNKYIQLPDKVVPLIELLERRINKHKEGKDVTGEDLQILLGQIIQNEDKSNPLSDENLKFALKDNFGVILSRRTIAKYRLELEIPSSRERYLL